MAIELTIANDQQHAAPAALILNAVTTTTELIWQYKPKCFQQLQPLIAAKHVVLHVTTVTSWALLIGKHRRSHFLPKQHESKQCNTEFDNECS